jgi:hypothetical protein
MTSTQGRSFLDSEVHLVFARYGVGLQEWTLVGIIGHVHTVRLGMTPERRHSLVRGFAVTVLGISCLDLMATISNEIGDSSRVERICNAKGVRYARNRAAARSRA